MSQPPQEPMHPSTGGAGEPVPNLHPQDGAAGEHVVKGESGIHEASGVGEQVSSEPLEHGTDRVVVDDAAGRPVEPPHGSHEDAAATTPNNGRMLAIIAASLAALLLLGLLIWRPWSKNTPNDADTSPSPDVVTSPPQVEPTTSTEAEILAHPSRMFRAGNVYSQDISKAPMEANSAAMTQHLVKQVTSLWNGNSSLNAYQYHGTLYKAAPSTKKITVKYYNCQNKKEKGVPYGLVNGPKYFMNVPMPGNAVPAKGTDGQVAVWSPGEDKLWEFWVTKKDSKGAWYACWGGRIDNVSKSMGQMPYLFGASASGLAVTGSMVSIEEAKALKIEHAIGLNIPEPAAWNKISYPANRSDGFSKNPNALREGARLRLDPSVNVDSLQMTPLAKAIAKAAQKYGFIVTDKAGAVAVVAEGGERRMVNNTGATVAANPWKSMLGSNDASTVLKGFPWDKMQVIQTNWGTPKGYVDPHAKAAAGGN